MSKTDLGYRNINRDENYQKRMEWISNIACKLKSCGWDFGPSRRCDVNTYTKRGNRFVGIMSREERNWGGKQENFYKRAYIVYFLHKDITARELKYIGKEMDRNKGDFSRRWGIYEPKKFININTKEIYTSLYNEKLWNILKKIQKLRLFI